MKLSDFLRRFDIEGRNGQGWAATCPAHPDPTPSLSVRYFEDGSASVFCFAGCTSSAILEAVGLTLADIRKGAIEADVADVPRAQSHKDLGEVPLESIATMAAAADSARRLLLEDADAREYLATRYGIGEDALSRLGDFLGLDIDGRIRVTLRNADGAPVGFQRRLTREAQAGEAKWMSPHSAMGAWPLGFIGPLGDGPVFITEGPSDGLVLAGRGLNVLAVLGSGAGDAVSLFADALAGREVYVIGDNDESGEKFNQKVIKAIDGVKVGRVPAEFNDIGAMYEANPSAFTNRWKAIVRKATTMDEGSTMKDEEANAYGTAAIVRFAQGRFDFIKSTDGLVYAVSRTDGSRTAREISTLRTDIAGALWKERGKTTTKMGIPAALEILAGLALDLPETQVGLRTVAIPGGLEIDLGDETGSIVRVTAEGWNVLPATERSAHFRRTAATRVLPTPKPGGHREILRDLLGLTASDPRWTLLWGWMVGAHFEDRPRPILWVTGPGGAGKTSRARFLLGLVDPADQPGVAFGKNLESDTVSAAGRYVPTWDNIGNVSAASSDWLCRIVTGATDDKRTLYTDDTLRVRTIRRTGIASSLSLPYGLQPDALQRILHVEFDRMPDEHRRSETAITRRYDAEAGRIFGALLDDVAKVLGHIEEIRADEDHDRLLPLGRMADFTQILHALDAAEGTLASPTGFAATYLANVKEGLVDVAEEDPVVAAIIEVARRGKGWVGRPAELLNEIRPILDGMDADQEAIPRTGKGMGALVRKHEESLHLLGIEVIRPASSKNIVLVAKGAPAPAAEGGGASSTSHENLVGQPRPRVPRGR